VLSFLDMNGRTQFGRSEKDIPKTQLTMNTPATIIFSDNTSVRVGTGVIETNTTSRAAPVTDSARYDNTIFV
jgi:hypothetical protein